MDQKLVSSGPGVDLTIVKVVEVLVETLEACFGLVRYQVPETYLDLPVRTAAPAC